MNGDGGGRLNCVVYDVLIVCDVDNRAQRRYTLGSLSGALQCAVCTNICIFNYACSVRARIWSRVGGFSTDFIPHIYTCIVFASIISRAYFDNVLLCSQLCRIILEQLKI